MKNRKIPFGIYKLIGCENIAVLQTEVILFIEETLFLNSRHIEHVKLGHYLFKVGSLNVFKVICLDNIVLDIARELELFGRNEDKLHVIIS